MDLEEIKQFFKLEGNPDLFKLALSPPSCGGGDKFTTIALKGDKILDSALIPANGPIICRSHDRVRNSYLLLPRTQDPGVCPSLHEDQVKKRNQLRALGRGDRPITVVKELNSKAERDPLKKTLLRPGQSWIRDGDVALKEIAIKILNNSKTMP